MRLGLAAGLLAALAWLPGCSLVANMAVNSIAGLLAEGEAVLRSDDDLDLVKAPLANNLWLMETMLETSPEHREMLLSATKGFLLFAYGFVEPDLFDLDFTQFEEKQAVRRRAARLYRRATGYGMRGLEVNHPGIEARLRQNPEAAAPSWRSRMPPWRCGRAPRSAPGSGWIRTIPRPPRTSSLMGALLNRSVNSTTRWTTGWCTTT